MPGPPEQNFDQGGVFHANPSPPSLLTADEPGPPNSCTGAPLVPPNTLERDGKLDAPAPKAGVEPKEADVPAAPVPKLKAKGEGVEPAGKKERA